jgi:hypothetical protein
MEYKLLLNDLLNLTPEELSRTKIRLNTYNGDKNPIEEFKKNPQSLLDWNYWNNKRYKQGQLSIGLVNMGNNRWLLFTIGEITKILEHPIKSSDNINGVQVEYTTLKKYEHLYGRVVLRYHNKTQQLFRNADLINDLEVFEILPSVFTGFDFPGYDNVSLSFEQLKTIVDGQYESYNNALCNQKAVYLQTDKATGKLYVGSATAKNGMLLARWRTYVINGHGGNQDLKKLVEEQGLDYVKNNFQYTILENFNSKVDDAYVLRRESYWKEVLQSRKFGYNKN